MIDDDLRDLFACIAAKQAQSFPASLTAPALLRYGSSPPAVGHAIGVRLDLRSVVLAFCNVLAPGRRKTASYAVCVDPVPLAAH